MTLSDAKLMKEQNRAQNKSGLLEIINNSQLADSAKQSAVEKLVTLTDIAERELAAEILLEAKGFTSSIVSISGASVDVVLGSVDLTDAQRAQIEDIVARKTGISSENIRISALIEN
ncbi:MAG: SpoIIIAH-like family protein [Lachnospiraceae bacterium]|nr:SpoIIIAH-like family protein [Lachnospiraceae bacterium]